MTSAWTRRGALRRAAGRALALTVLAGAVGVGLPASAGAAEPAGYVTLAGDGGMFREGGHRIWRTGAGDIAVTGSLDGQIEVQASGGTSGETYTLRFAAPPGETLAAGDYELAVDPAEGPVPGHPALQVEQQFREDCETEGRFRILDVAPDLSSLWLVYDQKCSHSAERVFGEIRYGMPAPDPDLLVAPGRIAWPGEDVGEAGVDVPVTLVNTGASPVAVSGASVTAGGSDFALTGGECAVIAAGATCQLRIGFTPTVDGVREGTLSIETDTSVGTHAVSLYGTGYGGISTLSQYAQNGYYDGMDVETFAASDGTTFRAVGDASQVEVEVVTQNYVFRDLRFSAGAGQVLEVGKLVTDTSAAESATGPGIGAGNPGDPCTASLGNFTVHELAFADGRLSKFSATFTHRCAPDAGSMFGSVTWRADNPAKPMPGVQGVAPEPVWGLEARPMYDSLVLSWQDPVTPDWATTVVRGALGTKAPTSPTAGFAVYTGKAGKTTVSKMRLGSTISYAAFARDSEGLVAPRATVTVHGSSITLATSKPAIVYGGTATLSGTLLDATTKKGVQGSAVNIWARHPGKETWYAVGDTRTGSGGKWKLTVDPGETYEFWVFHDGTDSVDLLGATAGPVKITVATYVDVFAPKTKGKLGKKFEVLTAVSPAAAGKKVQLQEYVKGKWKTVVEAKLAKDVTTLTVKPKTKGTHTYRVYKAGDSKRGAGTSKSVKIKVT